MMQVKKSSKIFIACLSCLAAITATAQSFENETKENLRRNREAMEKLSIGSSGDSGYIKKQLESNAASVKAIGGLEGANQSLGKTSKEDFLALAGKKATPEADPNRSDLMIFVSLSMPEEALKNYSIQAKRFGAMLVLRGFVDDKMSATREKLVKLNPGGAEWQISPEPFKTFKVTKVPAIVLANAESSSLEDDGCAKPSSYTAVFGDINIKDALDKISLHGQAPIAKIAKARLINDQKESVYKVK